jgi:hypothetical protein
MDRKAEADETTRRHRSRTLHVYQDEDGMIAIRGRLAPDVGAVLIQALTAAREALYQKANAQNVPAGTSRADIWGALQACDASRVVMRHDPHGRIVEVGARTRTIPPALRRALHHRDRGCRFPGCGLRFSQGHHIRHWAYGDPRRSRISPCSVVDITAPSTKRDTRSSGTPVES